MGQNRRWCAGRNEWQGCALTVLILGNCSAPAGLPSFSQQPPSQTAWAGQTVRLSASATADPAPRYQWLENRALIAGATNQSLELFCVSMVQANATYSLVASNSHGAVTSAPAYLRVRIPEADSTPFTWGVNDSVWNDGVMASDFRGQEDRIVWVDLVDTSSGGVWGTDVYTDDSSISAAAYHAGALPQGHRGTVRLHILGSGSQYAASDRNGVSSSSYGPWPGSFEVLGTAPTITRHPASTTRMIGGNATFRVEAFGAGKLRYQWRHNSAVIPGATNSTLVLAISSEAQAGCYTVLVSDDESSTSSQHAILGVLPERVAHFQTIAWDPAKVRDGDFRHVLVTGHTNGGSVVWGNGFYSADSDLGLAAVHAGLVAPGRTQLVTVVCVPRQPAFLSDTNHALATRMYAFPYRAIALAGTAPTIINDPLSQAIPPGETRRLEVTCQYPGSFTVQWRRNGEPVPGATRSTFQTLIAPPGTLDVYDAVVSTPGNPVPSLPAHVFTLPSNPIVYSAASATEASAFLGARNFLVTAPMKGSLTNGGLYGTGVYTSDSSPERAAVHAGRLAPGDNAMVTMYAVGAWSNFVGRVRHSVESFNFAAMPGYVFVMPKSLPSSPVLTMVSPGRMIISSDSGYPCQVWASGVASPAVWSPVASFVLTNSIQLWVDPDARAKSRFYRVTLAP